MQRQFTSGSRQAPDPFDQFLEENNFYRKHTARDASCLFRVISEQMYDTQLHHLAIRKKCVRYMRKHRNFFAPLIERDLDEYLDDMSKPKTYGTLIELQAVGYMFQRNVLLFEPFNLGNFYSARTYFNNVFRVFYTPERHFDSVFTCDYIKDAAICQAICYEILYKDLYKLPDVAFAVEHMLHSLTMEATDFTCENNENGYCTRMQLADGRSFEFDLPQDTNCILENYELCHFHHTNFPRLSDDLHREMKIHNNCDDYEKSALCKTAESLLPQKYISCVRQLLQEGITPFPYKVAKALDPHMYRNIEFDAWNEQRKEQKLQNWYNGDSNFKVGAKCHVKLCKSENDVYTCHIQEIAVDKGYCIVFVEQLGEKRLVPYESLTPLPPDQFKPWTLPYRFQRHMQKYSSVRLTRHYNYRFKLNGQLGNAHDYCTPISPSGKSSEYLNDFTDDDIDKDEKPHYVNNSAHHHRNGCYYKLKQYTHFENFRAHTVEYCAMPLTVEHTQRGDLESKSGSRKAPTNENNGNLNVQPRNAVPEMRMKTEANVPQRMVSGSGGGSVPEEMMHTYNGMEHPTGLSAPAFIIPDFHYLYPAPQYGAMPEDFYAYGYDPTMHPPPPPPTATLMPTGYYMYPPTGAPPPPPHTTFAPAPNNIYMQAPQLPPPLITAAAPHPAAAVAAPHLGSSGPFYQANVPFCANLAPANTIETSGILQTSSPQVHYDASNNRHRISGPTTTKPQSSGRINWEAKKSVEISGIDLPTDVATLRYFYNLGLEYYLMKRSNDDANAKVNGNKFASKIKQENGNEEVVRETKSDSNNNSMTNLNANIAQAPNQNVNQHPPPSTQNHHSNNNNANNGSGKGGHNMHRRYPSRYFNNNRERPTFLRNQNNNNSNNSHSTNTSANQNSSNHNPDYPGVGTGGGGGSKYAHNQKANNGGQANINRSGTPSSSHSHSSTQQNSKSSANTNGIASLATSVAEHGMPSPHVPYDNQSNNSGEQCHGGKIVKQTAVPYFQQPPPDNTLMTGPYSPYGNFGGEPPMSILPPTTAAGSIYLHMPMPGAAHPIGIYAPQPSQHHPPHTAIGMQATPTSTAICTPIPFPTPPNNGSATQHYMPSPSEAGTTINMAIQGPNNGFYAASSELTNTEMGMGASIMHGSGSDGIQFQCIPFAAGAAPPTMPFYYTTGSALAPSVTNGGMQAMNSGVGAVQPIPSGGSVCGSSGISAGPGTQAYWCQPSNGLLPLPTSTPQTQGSSVCVTVSNSNATTNGQNASSSTSRSRENK